MDYFSNNQPRTVEVKEVLEQTKSQVKVTLCRSWIVNGNQNPVYVDITTFPLNMVCGTGVVEKSEYIEHVGSVYTIMPFRESEPFSNKLIVPGMELHILPKWNHMFRQLKLIIMWDIKV